MLINRTVLMIAAGAGLVLVLAMRAKGAQGIGAAVGQGVVDFGVGTVLGAGDALGVPRTNQTQCQQDLAAGRTWDASFSCPAGTFIGSFF